MSGPASPLPERGATRDAVLGYLAALNAGDADGVAGRVTADFVNEHTSARGSSLTGRAAYRERLPGFLAAFSGLRYEVEDLLVDGDRAALAYRMTALMQRDGAPAVPIDVRGVFRLHVRDGLVAARADYWDGEVVAAQIAAVDAAAP